MEPEKDDGSDIMRKVIGIVSILAILLLLAGAGEVSAKQVEFNYQGRVKVNGQPFNGLGNFKFAIVDAPGSVSYWSNDGTSLSGSEPAAAVEIEVTDGVFNVIVGDDSIPNMTKLPPSIFNTKNKKLHLRTWFSDGTHGYEHLQPDKQITNALLMGLVAPEGTDIYVDPATGDDDNSGLNPDHPKLTIQGAWDALPNLLEQSATLHLADGVYRESVYMTGKTVVGDATITILGNITTPSAVRVTGADAGADTTPVRENAFRINDQKDLLIQGLLVDYTAHHGILATESSLTMTDCEIANTVGTGFHASTSTAYLERVISTDCGSGLYVEYNGTMILTNCEVYNANNRGVGIGLNSLGRLYGCVIDGVANTGISVFHESFCAPETTISNCNIGLYVTMGSTSYRTGITNIGNGTNEVTDRGGQIFDAF